MAFPASATALGKVVQSGEGSNSEVYTVPSAVSGYHLGAGLNPAQPSTWVNIPDGAFPITPPPAPTTGTGTGFAGGGLTANGAYTWAISSVTDYGETPAGPQLVVPSVGSYTGYILNLPAVTEGTTDNPVRRRRLYRTVNGGAQLKYVCEIGDLNLTTWHDALPDLQLGDNVPTSNTSGVTGTVTLSGGGVSVWTERSPSLNQGSMASGDFVINRATGNIIHATSDFSRTGVTCTWSGATLDTAQLVRDQITAIKDTAAAAVALSPGATQTGAIAVTSSVQGQNFLGNTSGTPSVSPLFAYQDTAQTAAPVRVRNKANTGDAFAVDPLGNVAAAGALTATALILAGHTAVPTATAAGSNTAASINAGGTDRRGVVNVTTGATPGAGALVTVTYGTAFPSTPYPVAIPTGAANTYGPTIVGQSATGFTIALSSTPPASTAFAFIYIVEP